MAKSMIKRRQEAERLRIDVFEASLKRVSRTARQPPDFQRALDEAAKGLGGVAIREAADWRPKLKTRDAGRLLLAAARHLYARYPVPAHLEAVWFDARGLTADEVRLRRAWYVTAAGGGSLFKAQPHAWLSRKEVHAFLTVGGDLSFDEAFWFAIAKSYTGDAALALRIAKTKVASMPRGSIAFRREVVRFFCAQPAAREEIDDLCDFFEAARRREAGYSLKGRTLASLRRQMLDWHRDVAAIERIEALRRRGRRGGAGPDTRAGRWEGAKLADWVWEPSAKEAKARGERFVIRQLTSAEDLVLESRAMHHCVATYGGKCISGNASIWVLRRICAGDIKRLLTIELNSQHRVVQVRGFANRKPTADESAIVVRWVKARGLVLPT